MNRKILKIVIGAIIIIICIGIFVALNFKKSDKIVARYLTYDHYRYSPIVLDDEIYFPSSFPDEDINNPIEIGMLGPKDKGWFNDCILLTGAISLDNMDEKRNKIKVVDDLPMKYIKGEYVNSINNINENINKYNSFVLCNDIKGDEKNAEIRVSIEKDYLIELVNEFGQVKADINDYENAEDSFYIYVDSPDNKIHERTFDNPIVYIGTIFINNNKLYYGNLNNEIKNELYNVFMEKYYNRISSK